MIKATLNGADFFRLFLYHSSLNVDLAQGFEKGYFIRFKIWRGSILIHIAIEPVYGYIIHLFLIVKLKLILF